MRSATERGQIIPHRVFSDRVSSIAPVTSLSVSQAMSLYETMLLARLSDDREAVLAARGDAFFHLRCSGHESMAVAQAFLNEEDWLHLHYRDKALLLARGVPVGRFFDSLLCNANSCSAGRQMTPFMADAQRHVLAQNIPVGNHALQAVGIARAVRDRASRPIVLCTLGDGATQQGEVLEAIGEAVRSHLPVFFVVEDNAYAISTTTAGRTFFSLPEGMPGAEDFLGLPIHRLDGRDPLRLHDEMGSILNQVRSSRGPGLAVVSVDRLCNHTNADDERVYRSPDEIKVAQVEGDPIRRLRASLLGMGVVQEAIERLEREAQARVIAASEASLLVEDPPTERGAKAPLPASLAASVEEAQTATSGGSGSLTMLEAIREVLRYRMKGDEGISLLGEDIEDPKGDVFGVTRGLTQAFPGRVRNSALSESTVVGTAIGMALAGEHPVAFIQFADFLPLALNQIMSELGSMYWRTAGQYECPVILMVACGGYRPGLGPFHAQTMESVLAHVPGIDVLMPSSAADAAGLLNAAFESGRPTVFLYPKSCLNDRDRGTSPAVESQLVALGSARRIRAGDKLTVVTWGSTVRPCERAADALSAAGHEVDLLDLRSISPWDVEAVCASARKTGKLLVVHEDNQTCGFGAEVVATAAERAGGGLMVRRLTRPDTYIPCNFSNQLEILPSYKRVLSAAAEMLELELSWTAPVIESHGGSQRTIAALGPSPADESVTVVNWLVEAGQLVESGERMAEMEADKAVFELVAPEAGRVSELLVEPGNPVETGTPLLRLEPTTRTERIQRASRDNPGTPRLYSRARARATSSGRGSSSGSFPAVVGLSLPTSSLGSLRVSNDELAPGFEDHNTAGILRRTGITSRRRVAPGESALSLAVSAARKALEQESLGLDQIDAIICSTTTPKLITPSMACLILNELSKSQPAIEMPAHDVIAACSGYLYALGAAFDMTRAKPGARVLVVSAEAMTTVTDPDDFDTALLFGDAATATVVSGPAVIDRPFALLQRPVLSAKGESGRVLRVPPVGTGFLKMNGLAVYAEAIRKMISALEQACVQANLSISDLDLIVPHQANARIIADIQNRLKVAVERVYVNIGEVGNTSSSSIPVALAEIGHLKAGQRVGLTAFGGGYTFAAAIMEAGGARPEGGR